MANDNMVRDPFIPEEPISRLTTTTLHWDGININDEQKEKITEIKNWMRYNDVEGRKLKQGFRTLFLASPGTHTSTIAGLIGKELNKDVFRVDVSAIVSKYIGETEKNLEMVFTHAENEGWILFFDEADALFGDRTDVKDSHDRYANQEISNLMDRIEKHNGLVILASNMKNNVDSAFTRRLNSVLKLD